MEIALMIEGQNGLNWSRWKNLAAAAEGLGFAGLYRSDHFTNANPPDVDSLELWVSLTWLASHTQRIEFGPLVTPFSFRHPAFTARMAAAVDDLSGGRLRLGVGAGWQEREHNKYGFDLLPIPERIARFEEGLILLEKFFTSPEPVTFHGKYYRMEEAVLLPRPARPGGPPIVIGGNGQTRTLPLAARYAAEWNAVFLTPEKFTGLSRRLDRCLAAAGRPPGSVKCTMMTGLIFGRTSSETADLLSRRPRSKADYQAAGIVVGEAAEVREQLDRLQAAGVERLMLQWLELDDIERLEAFGRLIL